MIMLQKETMRIAVIGCRTVAEGVHERHGNQSLVPNL